MDKRQFRDIIIIKRRMLIIFSILLLLFFGLVCRLCYVMIYDSSKLKDAAMEQWTSEVRIDAKRGRILDRNGVELAVSANVYRIDLDMNAIRQNISNGKVLTITEMDIKLDELSKVLSDTLGLNPQTVSKKLKQRLSNGLPQGAVILARRIEKTEADKVTALKKNGIMISPDTKRYYPNESFLSHVLGFTDIDGKGLYGVEKIYDEVLQGTPGKRTAEINKYSDEINSNTISTYSKPIQGKDVILTIDANIQHFAEKAAQVALTDNKAKAVSIIIADPNNGEILAMVNKPDYNPNIPKPEGKTSDELNATWRNRAVNDTFEPGSVFKVVTATAAMQEGVVKETDTFNCNGSLTVVNRVIHCWKRTGHGGENFVDILKNSCNVGFMTLGQRLGRENLNKYIKLFGFGKKTGIDLNGEASGIIKKTQSITDVDLATLSFGQVDTVSCIQYLAALNSIANGGKSIVPHVMKEISHVDENDNKIIDKTYSKYDTKQILDPKTMETLRGYLEKVISEGGGSKAFVDGYHIAGKTGTAQKPINGVYAAGKYVASFGGMAPADKPKITVVISIDEPDPSNYYAGQIAAPVAKEVFGDVFNYMSFTPQGSAESLLKDVTVPETRGMKKEEAIKKLKELNLAYDIDNNGDYIVNMSPLPGGTVKEGNKIVLYTGTTPTYNKVVVVPDLKGYGKEKAQQVLNSFGLKGNFIGDGVVIDQDMQVGIEVNMGTTIGLDLEYSDD
ncbi:MAG: stage V sporulation protein D [Clostridiaceae bacterium]|nr:stage V sporulation protein D [Clostridiaceae bacterium]